MTTTDPVTRLVQSFLSHEYTDRLDCFVSQVHNSTIDTGFKNRVDGFATLTHDPSDLGQTAEPTAGDAIIHTPGSISVLA